jgi:EpsI family protein
VKIEQEVLDVLGAGDFLLRVYQDSSRRQPYVDLVLYWYLAHDRAVASEYWAKFYLVTDSIRLSRSDGSLVRVTTPLRPGETTDAAQARLTSFAGKFTPLLNQYIPR